MGNLNDDKERVFVNGTPTKCSHCGQVKTGFRGDRSKHFLFKFKDREGLFCCVRCMRTYYDIPHNTNSWEY